MIDLPSDVEKPKFEPVGGGKKAEWDVFALEISEDMIDQRRNEDEYYKALMQRAKMQAYSKNDVRKGCCACTGDQCSIF